MRSYTQCLFYCFAVLCYVWICRRSTRGLQRKNKSTEVKSPELKNVHSVKVYLNSRGKVPKQLKKTPTKNHLFTITKGKKNRNWTHQVTFYGEHKKSTSLKYFNYFERHLITSYCFYLYPEYFHNHNSSQKPLFVSWINFQHSLKIFLCISCDFAILLIIHNFCR